MDEQSRLPARRPVPLPSRYSYSAIFRWKRDAGSATFDAVNPGTRTFLVCFVSTARSPRPGQITSRYCTPWAVG